MKIFYPSILALCLVFTSLNIHAQVPVYSSYPSAEATIFLDFDGHVVEGTSWNAFGPIFCEGASLTNTQITEIFNRVAEDYRPFNINITTDSTKYWTAPVFQRQRVIITTTSSWYGSAGGVSYLGSFKWGDHTPSFVFSALLGYNTKKVAEATSHEMGHTLGLRHQSTYNQNCIKTAEYNPGTGSGEIGWAPIMGIGYYRNFTLWNNGTNPQGCNIYQDDLGIITSAANGFGFRTDDHGASIVNASYAEMINFQFTADGVIEQSGDEDVFRFVIPSTGNLRIEAIPYSAGIGNSGSNLDLEMQILNQNFDVINTYNPGEVLNLSVDSNFAAGTYYMRILGKGNINASEYASLGSYGIISSFRPMAPLPLHKLELKGTQSNNRHQLNWVIEADESVVNQVLEVSFNKNDFESLANPSTTARSFAHQAGKAGWIHYRLRVSFDDGKTYYSNVVALPGKESKGKPVIQGNVVNHSIMVNSPSEFNYTIYDYNGRLVNKGKLSNGINHIQASGLSRGMYLVRFENGYETYNEKFMKQ